MKRRDFLTYTASFAGVLATKFTRADSPPCPMLLDGGTTNCPDDNPVVDGAPSWFTNASEGQWFQVPASNTSGDIGVPEGAYAGYSGAGVDQIRREYTLTCTGGHTNSSDNGVYVLELGREVPVWAELVQNSTNINSGDAGNIGNAAYPDGNPRSVHQWNASGIPVGDSIWLPSMTGQYQAGTFGSQVWELDRGSITNPPVSPANAPWTFHGHGVPESQSMSGLILEGGPAAYDPDTGLIWFVCDKSSFGVYPLWSINTVNGDIQRYPTWPERFPAPGTVSLNRGIMFIVDGHAFLMGRYSQNMWRLDLSNVPGNGLEVVTEGGSIPSYDPVLSAAAAHYHPATRKVYIYKPEHGSTIYTLDVPTDVVNGTFSWGTIAAGGTPPTVVGLNTDYSHFNIVQDMGNGQGALLTNNFPNLPTFMYKLPTS